MEPVAEKMRAELVPHVQIPATLSSSDERRETYSTHGSAPPRTSVKFV